MSVTNDYTLISTLTVMKVKHVTVNSVSKISSLRTSQQNNDRRHL